MSTHDITPEEVLAQLGLGKLPEAERNELLSSIGGMIYQAAIRKAWESLDTRKQDELMARLEARDTKAREQVDTFLREHVADFDRYVAQESNAFLETQRSIYREITSGKGDVKCSGGHIQTLYIPVFAVNSPSHSTPFDGAKSHSCFSKSRQASLLRTKASAPRL